MLNAVGRAASTLFRVAPKAPSSVSKTLPALQTVGKFYLLPFMVVSEKYLHCTYYSIILKIKIVDVIIFGLLNSIFNSLL